jgi:hypothetical protein
MGLVQIGFLGALSALAIPIIIHLVFGWRVRRVDLGTLRFLKIVLRENVRRRRLKRWLLLALRMTCLALLAFLFARPYLAAQHRGGGNRLLVILLDRSGSMGSKAGGSRPFELALGEAKKLVGDCGDEAQVEIALFAHDVHPIVGGEGAGRDAEGAPTQRVPGVVATLDKLTADLGPDNTSYAATNYEAALAWAGDVCVQSDRRRKEVYVFTDLQRSGFTATDVLPLPPDVEVHLVDLGQAFAANTAVTRVTPSKLSVRPGEPITLAATLLNAGQFPLKGVPVVLRLDGSRPAAQVPRRQEIRSTVDLDAGATGTVQFELQDLSAGLWQGHVAVQADDDLPFDDRRHVALMVADPLPVILVDGDPGNSPLTAETFFLEASLRLAPRDSEVGTGGFGVRGSGVGTRDSGARGSGSQNAEGRRQNAQILNPKSEIPSPKSPVFSGQPTDSPFEPIRVGLGSQGGLPDLRAAALVVLANVGRLPADDTRRLGEFVRQGGGLLVFSGDRVQSGGSWGREAGGLSAGQIVGTATADDPADGARLPWRLDGWDADHPIFAPFNDPQYGDLRRLAFRVRTQVKPPRDARVLAWFRGGEPALIERKLGGGKVLWFLSACDRDWSDWPRSRLYLPMVHQMLGYLAGLTEGGPVRNVLLDAAPAGAARPVPGVVDRGRFHEVINVDPRESELDRCTREEFAARLRLQLQDAKSAPSGRDAVEAAAVAQSRADEIWHWLMLPLVALLLCEVFLANRTTA